MTPLVFVALALAGGLGAVARYSLDRAVRARAAGVTPWGTISINLSGSFVLGIATGLAAAALLPADILAIVGTGFLGGYTTFATASVETVRIAQGSRFGSAAVVGLGTLIAAGLLAGFGLWVGSQF